MKYKTETKSTCKSNEWPKTWSSGPLHAKNKRMLAQVVLVRRRVWVRQRYESIVGCWRVKAGPSSPSNLDGHRTFARPPAHAPIGLS